MTGCGRTWVVLAATVFSLVVVIQGRLAVPIEGSLLLFLAGTTLHLFATTSMGIFLGTVAHSMPQFGLLLMLVLLPLQMLSGGTTPQESMPEVMQFLMLGAPTRILSRSPMASSIAARAWPPYGRNLPPWRSSAPSCSACLPAASEKPCEPWRQQILRSRIKLGTLALKDEI